MSSLFCYQNVTFFKRVARLSYDFDGTWVFMVFASKYSLQVAAIRDE